MVLLKTLKINYVFEQKNLPIDIFSHFSREFWVSKLPPSTVDVLRCYNCLTFNILQETCKDFLPLLETLIFHDFYIYTGNFEFLTFPTIRTVRPCFFTFSHYTRDFDFLRAPLKYWRLWFSRFFLSLWTWCFWIILFVLESLILSHFSPVLRTLSFNGFTLYCTLWFSHVQILKWVRYWFFFSAADYDFLHIYLVLRTLDF